MKISRVVIAFGGPEQVDSSHGWDYPKLELGGVSRPHGWGLATRHAWGLALHEDWRCVSQTDTVAGRACDAVVVCDVAGGKRPLHIGTGPGGM